MKHSSILRFLSMTIVLFYCCALAQAGQVITDKNKLWARQAIQQEKELAVLPASNSIAVLNFNNKSGNPEWTPLQKGMAVMLITDLAKVEDIQVVERIKMQALLDEMELGASGLVDFKTAPRVGMLLGANYLSSGDILQGEEEGNLEIDPSLLDVPQENIIEQPLAAGALDEFFALEKIILYNIIKQLNVYISPEKEAELNKPLSISTAALLALFLGIDHSDKGQYTQAADKYEEALLEDPNLKIAENSLQELKNMKLIGTKGAAVVGKAPLAPQATVVGLSTAAKIGLGTAALVAIGAATYYALDATSSSDDSSSVNGDHTTKPPSVVGVVPTEGVSLSCYGGSLTFTFSEPMSATGEANILVNDRILSGFFSRQSWSNDHTFTVSWDHSGTNQYCYKDSYETESTVIIQLLDFLDLAGYALSGIKRFSYLGDNFRVGNIVE